MKDLRVGIVGGGVAGASVALYLGEIGVRSTLFESSDTLVSGPPICHLHAGGNLYREISDKQCIALLKESVEFMRLYPATIDYRPTIIAVPKDDEGKSEDLLPRLQLLKDEYKKLIDKDKNNKLLGDVEDYFRFFSSDEIESLKDKVALKEPKTLEEWMIPFAKNVDLEKIKFPIVLVQEYGINIFRLASCATLALDALELVEVKTNHKVKEIKRVGLKWLVDGLEFDYLVNAAGFRSGEIDDMAGYQRDRLVEFKSAYISKCKKFDDAWPEVIFHGQRGTPKGMGQFTPYPNGYFQLHGMTKDITLFDNGLIRSDKESSQPKLDDMFLDMIDKGWDKEFAQQRGDRAIKHLSTYIPSFKDAKPTPKPLYGAQQIPGDDASLRAAEVSFEDDRYARCEIVKASSVLSMAYEISKKLQDISGKNLQNSKKVEFSTTKSLKEKDITKCARELCLKRDYPVSMADRSMKKQELLDGISDDGL